MIAPKVKVGITIFLTELGEIGCQFTSQNKVTLLGMLEVAKKIILDGNAKKEEPLIHPATEMPHA